MKKIISILLSVVLAASLFAGCGNKESAFSEQTTSTSSETAAPTSYLVVDGKSIDVPYLLKLDDYQVPLEHFRYYYLNIRDGYDSSAVNDEMEKSILDEALSYVQSDFAVKKLADKYNITLSEEDSKSIDAEVAGTMQNMGGETEFQAALQERYMTLDFYKSMLATDQLKAQLQDVLFVEGGEYATSEADVRAIISKDYIRASHIFLPVDTDGTTTNEKLISDILVRVDAGEDFNSLVTEFGKDTGMTDIANGYYFTYGDMQKPFEQAAYALEIGATSGIVQTSYGYHIIKRMELEDAYITENIATLTESCLSKKFKTILEEVTTSFNVAYSDQYSMIKTSTLS